MWPQIPSVAAVCCLQMYNHINLQKGGAESEQNTRDKEVAMFFSLLIIAGAIAFSAYDCIVVGAQAEEKWDRQRTHHTLKDDSANRHIKL